MIKVVYLAERADEMSHDECIEYWQEKHAPVVRDLPGLKKYTLGVPLDPSGTDWDGVAELYFESAEDVQTAFESEAGEQMLEDGPNFTREEPQINVTVDEIILHEE